MAPAGALLRPEPLPVEQLLFDSPLVRVATFRCPTGHALFEDSGPVINPVIVFPRTAVWIEHEGRRPFLSDPTIATLYNRGQAYRRKAVSETGDHCDWFALAPASLAEITAARNPRVKEDPDHPFAQPHTAADSRTYLYQRQLVERLHSGALCDPLSIEERVIRLAEQVLVGACGPSDRPGESERVCSRAARLHREHAEHARQILARRYWQSYSLDELARLVGVSVFHLCRVFRRQTGVTLHEYQTELRLRHALDRLPDGGTSLTQIALDVGFSSHSHFTAAFGRKFGVTPSAYARQAKAARQVQN